MPRLPLRWNRYMGVAVLALVVHGLFFWQAVRTGSIDREMTDGSQYMQMADNLLAGHGYSLRPSEPFAPDTIRTPVYPFVLAAFKGLTGSFHGSLYLSFILGLTIPLAGMGLARLLRLSPPVEILVGAALALDPHLFYYSFIYGSESYFLPLAAWAIYLTCLAMVKRSWKVGLAAGALFGLATLARPIVQFAPAFVICWACYDGWRYRWIRPKLLRTTGAFLAMFAVVVIPWLIRNVATFGAFDYSNVGWFNMYTRVAATTEMIAIGQRDYPKIRLEFMERLHKKGYVDHSPVEEWDVHGYSFKPIFQKETWEIIKHYPKEAVIVHIGAAFTVVSQDTVALIGKKLQIWDYRYPTFSPFVVLAQEGALGLLRHAASELSLAFIWSAVGRLIWLGLFALSLLGPFIAWQTRRDLVPLAVFLLLYELGIVALSLNAAAQAEARYRAQFLFVEWPLAVLTVHAWISKTAGRVTRPALAGMRCSVCGAASFIRRRGNIKKVYELYRCGLCQVSFVRPLPSSEDIAAYYSQSYFFGGTGGGYVDYDRDKAAAKKSLEGFLDVVDRFVLDKGTMLDVGAATGVFLETARSRGWKVVGHEVSSEAAERARNKGIEMSIGELPDQGLNSRSFHAVTMLDVIEHLPDPRTMLKRVHDLLAERGVLLINTPDAGSVYARLLGRRWHAYCPPEHLIWFNRRSLTALLEQEGFQVEWIGRVPKRFRLSYILQTAAHWTGSAFLSRLASRVESLGPNPSLPLDLRDNLVVLARKI